MSTREERAAEAREERREHPDCIGCALGLCYDNHDDIEDDE